MKKILALLLALTFAATAPVMAAGTSTLSDEEMEKAESSGPGRVPATRT